MTNLRLSETSHPYLAGDLEWVIFSPFLTRSIASPDLSSLPQSLNIVAQVRENPSELQIFLQTMKRQNLGTYFEYLVIFWLQKLDAVTVIATNFQVQATKRTVGEFDILFAYQEHHYHWELAIKFYANTGEGVKEHLWVGPLKRDNLKKKLDRLFDHQLALSECPEGKQALADVGIETVHASPFVKGMLFDKKQNIQLPSNLPERISTTCSLRQWFYIHDLPINNASHYCFLTKPRWISFPEKEDWIKLDSVSTIRTQLAHQFSKFPHPIMVTFGLQENSQIKELDRLFVMPENW